MALIALDDPSWAELQHAYGAADDIPELLANLSIPKAERSEDDPIEDTWHELWSSLCHQGDVYSASFAAVPHIVDALLQQPELFMFNFIELPITIAIERREAEISIPELVEPEYSEAFQSLARFAASVILDKHDKSMSSALLTALALVHENTGVARMLGQITAYEADEAVDLFLNR